MHIFRTPFPKNTSGGLHLDIQIKILVVVSIHTALQISKHLNYNKNSLQYSTVEVSLHSQIAFWMMSVSRTGLYLQVL